jgi:hypothetical protein
MQKNHGYFPETKIGQTLYTVYIYMFHLEYGEKVIENDWIVM